MSELKLHQAALERENFELRSSQLNNNNTIANDRRLPPVPANRIRTNSTSGSMVKFQIYNGSFSSLEAMQSIRLQYKIVVHSFSR